MDLAVERAFTQWSNTFLECDESAVGWWRSRLRVERRAQLTEDALLLRSSTTALVGRRATILCSDERLPTSAHIECQLALSPDGIKSDV